MRGGRVRAADARGVHGGRARAWLSPFAAVLGMLVIGLAVKSEGKFSVGSDDAALQADADSQRELRGVSDVETSDPKSFIVPASLDTSPERVHSN